MKKLLALLLLVLITSISFGQNNQKKIENSIDNSSSHSNFKGTIEMGYLKANHVNQPNFTHARIKLNVVGGYQINPYITLGLGTGLRYYLPELWPLVPLFANFNAKIPNRKYSPYFSLGLGHTFDIKDEFEGIGFLLDPSVGISVKTDGKLRLNVAVNYEMHLIREFNSYSKEFGPICILLGVSF